MSSSERKKLSSSSEEEEEEEVLNLEEEVERMCEKLVEYRTTLPDQLTSTLSSLLAAQRPSSLFTQSQSALNHPDDVQLVATELPEEAEKIQLLKHKIASNASTLPIVLNRMKEYVARIDNLQSSNTNIHPAFKKKRIT